MTKRLFDLFFSFLAIILLSPIFIFLVILIYFTEGFPVFYLQERIGFKGKNFKIIKFRTMHRNADKEGPLITVDKDQRITNIGGFLRRYKLDELPQIFNVFKGEMSFVGPRPEVEKYVKMYNMQQRRVLDLLPGITDPASLYYISEEEVLANVKNPEQHYINVIMNDKININLKYAEKANIFFDFIIILKTIIMAIKK